MTEENQAIIDRYGMDDWGSEEEIHRLLVVIAAAKRQLRGELIGQLEEGYDYCEETTAFGQMIKEYGEVCCDGHRTMMGKSRPNAATVCEIMREALILTEEYRLRIRQVEAENLVQAEDLSSAISTVGLFDPKTGEELGRITDIKIEPGAPVFDPVGWAKLSPGEKRVHVRKIEDDKERFRFLEKEEKMVGDSITEILAPDSTEEMLESDHRKLGDWEFSPPKKKRKKLPYDERGWQPK